MVSGRRACRVLGQPRGTQRYEKRPAEDEEELRARIVALASRFGRYGYQLDFAPFCIVREAAYAGVSLRKNISICVGKRPFPLPQNLLPVSTLQGPFYQFWLQTILVWAIIKV